MACENQIGVKNILMTFRDCNTGAVLRKVSHKLSTDELPTIRTCEYTNETLTGGYVRRIHGNASMALNVIRNTGVPLSNYQGCAEIDIQIEYLNGLIYTGVGGSVIGDERSDTHDVPLEISYRLIEETLPVSALEFVDAA
jgi:hypothetical protein